ncbi:MAG: Ig-like domain-containing protein, partial [Duncaniella sp.]|nr:Ig-like domain-containing protein [Duncaniella sp.]
MTAKIFRIVVILACLMGYSHSWAQTIYENEPASVIWPFNNVDEIESYTSSPDGGFSIVTYSSNGATYNGTGTIEKTVDHYETDENGNEVVFVKVRPVNGKSDVLTWTVAPARGLTFTPTKVSGWIQRYGTDVENGVTVTVSTDEVKSLALGTFTALRNNKNREQITKDDKDYDSKGVNKFEIELTAEQQKQLSTTGRFSLSASIGVAAGKDGAFSDIRIYGVLNGAAEAVAKYSLAVKSSIEGACEFALSPKADVYDEGTEVNITAVPNFGYKFINWTDAAGKVLSEKPEFTYTVNSDSELTANFEAVNIYELAYTVEGGANDYQVQVVPEGTFVDGKRMYEEGTKVTLTASANEIIKFASWGDGQNSSEITVTMDADHTDIVANFDALDYIVAWDFYKGGAAGRAADFTAADNDDVQLVMRNAAGETSSWLDKSQMAAGGYEGRPAAVNWRTTGLGDYYWQTRVNASAFTDIKVITAMAFNSNAYSKQNVEYSLDGENWKTAGTITISGAKKWTDATFSLPAEADNQSELYIRFISDKTSSIAGSPSSNDGIALGATYIIGSPKLIDDGTAPVLVSVVPEDGSETASINGKIVLTFDEKVKVKDGATATLAGQPLTPSVTGKSVMFDYHNLNYASSYRFVLPAGSVMDLTDNAIDKEIVINFTTKTRPEVTKGSYDAVVTNVDELIAAIAQAEKRADTSKRFRIFMYDGVYQMPVSETATKSGDPDKGDGDTVYPDPTTYINTPNISFIGESRDGVVLTNTIVKKYITTKYGDQNVLEGIGRGDVLNLNKNATGTYFQHLTLKSDMGDDCGRDIVLNDKSDKTICKDVCLWAFQDTYVSNNENSRFYFEGGLLRGRTDFLCGKGDVYYKGVLLEMCEKGGYLTAPSKPKKYGYVFKDCEIIGSKSDVSGNYTLGRPWGEGYPTVSFIDTKMTALPSADGWNEMSGGWPNRMAEYNSTTSAGTVIDLKVRKNLFANKTHSNNPVLTKAEADELSYANVMGGDDDWDPATDAEQAPAPTNVSIDGVTLSWDDNKYAFLWAVCKDGKVIAFTTEPTYTVEPASGAKAAAVYSVRAANEMGGLGDAVVASDKSAITDVNADAQVVSTVYYNLQGIRVNATTPGVLVKVDTLASGET